MTKKEEKMISHNNNCRAYEDKGYTLRDRTFSVSKGNVLGILLPLPAVIVLWIAARVTSLMLHPEMEYNKNMLFIVILIVVLIFLHELTHGMVAAVHCKNGWKSISLGFNVEGLNPYCACSEPLSVRHYRKVLLTPMFVEGLIPIIIGVLIGNYSLICVGCLMFLCSGGDMLICLMTFKDRKDDLVIDHPYMIGYTVLSKA